MALCVGELTKKLFDASNDGVIGETIQTFRNTTHLKTSSGDLICITTYPAKSPININMDAVKSWPESGTLAFKGGHLLKVGPVQVDFTNALVHTHMNSFVMTSGMKKRAFEAATALSILNVEGSMLDSKSVFYDRLSKSVKQIAHAVQEGDFGELQKIIPQVVGLGTGSTPSGDDFLAGLLFSINKILESNGQKPIAFSIQGETSWASKKFIEYAQKGYVSEPVENMSYALLCSSREGISFSIADICRVGHSSGIDAAVGVLIAACYGKEEQFLVSLCKTLNF